MKRTVLLYGLLGGVLIVLLEAIEYRFLLVDRSLEIYGGLVALLFATLGIWLGRRLARPRAAPVRPQAARPAGPHFVRDAARQQALGITARELQILEHIAAGLSTREIAGRLFLSENTVKTHSARLYAKLSAARRTQAVKHARDAGLIP
jgi:two-component system, NarL family, response regulator LiaR